MAELTRWDGKDVHYVGIGTGYDVAGPSVRRANENAYNARLTLGSEYVDFYCLNVETGFAVAGNTAQSRTKRDFYAHHFVQDNIRISAIMADQRSYGNLCEFIWHTHHEMLLKGGGQENLTQLFVAGTLQDKKTRKGVTLQPTGAGRHDPLVAYGYVQGIRRRHERFVYAPTFQFEFVVAYLSQLGGVNNIDDQPFGSNMLTWDEIIANINQQNKETPAFVPPQTKPKNDSSSQPFHDKLPSTPPKVPAPSRRLLTPGITGPLTPGG